MNILVTAIGSFSSACVIDKLRRKGHHVVGCDIYDYNWLAQSRECDAFYQAPYATEEQRYVEFLLDISEKESVDFIIPLTDLEVDVLNKHRAPFVEKGIIVCIQSPDCLCVVRNKYNLFRQFADDSIVKVPMTVLANSRIDAVIPFSYPVIAKPTKGRSSEGLCTICTEDELQQFLKRHSDYINQEKIEGSVYTVDYVRDNKGNDNSVIREELLRTKNGAGTTVRLLNDELLRETSSYIGEKLNVCGCVNMEFIHGKAEGQYYLIDINPRFSAGIAFTIMAGYDVVISNLNCFCKKEIMPPVRYKEQIMIKKYVEEVLWTES